MEGTTSAARPYRVAAATITWLALAFQLYLTLNWYLNDGLSFPAGLVRYISYFTILTNILAALVLSAPSDRAGSASADAGDAPGGFFARPAVAGGTMVYMLAVLLAYVFVLRVVWHPHGNQAISDILLNILTPLLYIVYWFRYVPKGWLRGAHVGWWLVYPAVYLIFTLLHGIRSGFYPYPYVDTIKLGDATAVMNCGIMLAGIAVLGWIGVMIDRRMSASASTIGMPA